MRGFLAGLLFLAACYTPSVPSGVACAPNGLCPEGQSCVAGVCTLDGAPRDAAVDGGDAMNADDRDGDGVPNASDNCPAFANPDQADEDGDRIGDGCDPCPQLAGTDSDADSDKIGDACDPNPGTQDARWLFADLRGPPGWPGTNGWQSTAGALRVTAPGEPAPDDEFLVLPLTLDGRMTFDNYSTTIAITVEQLAAGAEKGLGIAYYDAKQDLSLACELGDLNGSRIVRLTDDVHTIDQRAYAWTTNVAYVFRMVRHGTSYSCDVNGPPGALTASGTSSVVPQNGAGTSVWAYGVTAQFTSLTVYGPAP